MWGGCFRRLRFPWPTPVGNEPKSYGYGYGLLGIDAIFACLLVGKSRARAHRSQHVKFLSFCFQNVTKSVLLRILYILLFLHRNGNRRNVPYDQLWNFLFTCTAHVNPTNLPYLDNQTFETKAITSGFFFDDDIIDIAMETVGISQTPPRRSFLSTDWIYGGSRLKGCGCSLQRQKRLRSTI